MRETAEVSLSMRRRRPPRQLPRPPHQSQHSADWRRQNFITSRNFEIAAGRNIGPDDVEFGRAVVILGDDIVKRLFPNEESLGRLVRIDGQSYTVIGVLAPKGSSFGQSQDSNAIVPLTQYLEIYGGYGQAGRFNRSIGVNVQARSQAELTATQDIAIGSMRLVRSLAPEDDNDFEVFSNDSLIESFNKVAGIVAIGAFVISAIALLASGVGRHEHHARERHRAHQGDRHPQEHRRQEAQYPHAIPHRGRAALDGRPASPVSPSA